MIENSDRRQVGRRAAHGWRRRRPGIGKTQALGLLVSVVFGARTRHEMVGVAATPDVAAVAQHQAVGDRPVLHLPGEAVGEPRLALVAETAVAVLQVALPDVAAAQRVGPDEVRDPLTELPAPLSVPLPPSVVASGATFLVHAGNLTEVGSQHLVWSLEVQPRALADSFSGVSKVSKAVHALPDRGPPAPLKILLDRAHPARSSTPSR